MAGLIPLPDPDAPAGAPRLWINPVHVVTAAAVIDRVHEPHRLYVELKLQGLNLARYWLADGNSIRGVNLMRVENGLIIEAMGYVKG